MFQEECKKSSMGDKTKGDPLGDELFLFGQPFTPVDTLPPEFSLAETPERQHQRRKVYPSTTPVVRPQAEEEDDDDEVEIVGQSGSNANTDWPHAREDCTLTEFAVGDRRICRLTCDKCFCFVCDVVASKCPDWKEHCVATRKSQRWANERVRVRAARRGAPIGRGAGQASSPQQASMTMGRRAESICRLVRLLRNDPERTIAPESGRDRAVRRMLSIERNQGGGVFFENFVASCVAALHAIDAQHRNFAHNDIIAPDAATVVVTAADRVLQWKRTFAECSLPSSTILSDVEEDYIKQTLSTSNVLIVDGRYLHTIESVAVRRVVLDHPGIFQRQNEHLITTIANLDACFTWVFARDPFNFHFQQLCAAAAVLKRDSSDFRMALSFMESCDPTMLARHLSSWAVCSSSTRKMPSVSSQRQLEEQAALAIHGRSLSDTLAESRPGQREWGALPAEQQQQQQHFRQDHQMHIWSNTNDAPPDSPFSYAGVELSPKQRQQQHQHLSLAHVGANVAYVDEDGRMSSSCADDSDTIARPVWYAARQDEYRY